MQMEYHELADLFDLLEGDEYQKLVQDIQENGLLDPITTYQGKILDGRNRYRACLDAEVEPVFREYNGDDPLAYVVSQNILRRHDDLNAKGLLALRLLPKLEEQAKERQRKHAGTAPGRKKDETDPTPVSGVIAGEARQQAAKMVGIGTSTVSAMKKIEQTDPDVLKLVQKKKTDISNARKLINAPEEMRTIAVGMINAGTVHPRVALAAARREIMQEREHELPPDPENCRLLVCDVAHLSEQIEPGSVDVIITDPPYPKEYLPCYEELAKLAAAVLKPGGSLLAMSGHTYLPQILAMMTPHVDYVWTLAYFLPGANIKIWDPNKNIMTAWKPVLWFRRGNNRDQKPVRDVITSVKQDKQHHTWGQSETGIGALIAQFSEPCDVVLDPFLGGGTTAVCSLALGRRFIGSDIDDQAILIARSRLAAAQTETPAV